MGIVLGFICLFLILVGIVNFIYYRIKEKKYYKVTGTIIDIEEVKTYGRNRMSRTKTVSSIYYHPIVEFEDNKGNVVQIFSEDGNTHSPVYPVGTKINLLVNPNDNTRILFDTATDKWQVPLVCVSIGVIGLILIVCYVILFVPTEPILIQRPTIVYFNHDTVIKRNGAESTFQQLPQGLRDTLLSIIKSSKY